MPTNPNALLNHWVRNAHCRCRFNEFIRRWTAVNTQLSKSSTAKKPWSVHQHDIVCQRIRFWIIEDTTDADPKVPLIGHRPTMRALLSPSRDHICHQEAVHKPRQKPPTVTALMQPLNAPVTGIKLCNCMLSLQGPGAGLNVIFRLAEQNNVPKKCVNRPIWPLSQQSGFISTLNCSISNSL